MKKPPAVSFEFFPPRDDAGWTQRWATIEKLAPFRPGFVSVTYGAGGTTRERTDRIVRRIRTETPLEPAAHITCVGAARRDRRARAKSWWEAGIRHLVALRGDPPWAGGTKFAPHPGGYAGGAALVAASAKIAGSTSTWRPIRRSIRIRVGRGRSRHPQAQGRCRRLDGDHAVLLRCRPFPALPRPRARGRHQGAARARHPADHEFRARSRFAERCGASVPAWLRAYFAGSTTIPSSAISSRPPPPAISARTCRRGRRPLPFLHAEPPAAHRGHLPPPRPEADAGGGMSARRPQCRSI